MRELEGSVVLVTGASRGLGAHLAGVLAARGAVLALAARSEADLQAVAGEVAAAHGTPVSVFPADLAEQAERRRLVAEVEGELGRVDVLVNNAGIETAVAYQEEDPEHVEKMVAVNLAAPMVLTRLVLPGMLARGRGHVVNMASVSGKASVPYMTAYSATKAGLIAFTHALRTELVGAPVGFSAVCPGFVAGDGMYARAQQQGLRAPFYIGSTTTAKVSEAVVRAITGNRAELVVNSVPVEPLASLGRLFPQLTPRLTALAGVHGALRRATGIEHRD